MARKEKKNFIDWFLSSQGATSIAVILMGFLIGTLLVIAVGRNPSGLFTAIGQSLIGKAGKNGAWNFRNVGETLAYSIPYVLCGLSMGFAARVGLFNIGGEGQYIIGMLAAQAVAVCIPSFPFQWLVCLAVGLLAGAIWGGIVGILKAKYKVSEVVATIMLNYIALYLARIIAFRMPAGLTNRTYQTAPLAKDALLARFLITNSNLNIGFFFMIAACLIYFFVMEKTKLGFSFRATGFNMDAARCSGINADRAISVSMAISGAFAGLAGACVLLGGAYTTGRIIQGMDNYGFMGIAVALVGNNRALGIFLSGILFGVLKQAQSIMQGMNIPKEITFIIQGLIVIFIALRSGLELVRAYRAKVLIRKEVKA
ncbi:MAG: ABC transporter permease [Bullifex sp.]|nr:ABC transporter permease [Bullifex sp.]